MIQRYTMVAEDIVGAMDQYGRWVAYDDHLAALDAQREEIAELVDETLVAEGVFRESRNKVDEAIRVYGQGAKGETHDGEAKGQEGQ